MQTITAKADSCIAQPVIAPFLAGAGGPRIVREACRRRPAAGHRLTTENHRAVVIPTLAPFLTEYANASNQRTMPADEPCAPSAPRQGRPHLRRRPGPGSAARHQRGPPRRALVEQPLNRVRRRHLTTRWWPAISRSSDRAPWARASTRRFPPSPPAGRRSGPAPPSPRGWSALTWSPSATASAWVSNLAPRTSRRRWVRSWPAV